MKFSSSRNENKKILIGFVVYDDTSRKRSDGVWGNLFYRQKATTSSHNKNANALKYSKMSFCNKDSVCHPYSIMF